MVLLSIAVASFIAAVVFGVTTWRVLRDDRRRAEARVAALAAAIDGEVDDGRAPQVDAAASAMPSAAGHPLSTIALGLVISVVVIVGLASWSARPAASPAPVARPASLELLSMHHERTGDTLVVTGLVRNPSSANADHLTAVVFAFDASGNFLASGRAPLEFTALAPGDESPFRVSIPDAAAVGRYRVSFRTETGLVRHVDRRAAQIARN